MKYTWNSLKRIREVRNSKKQKKIGFESRKIGDFWPKVQFWYYRQRCYHPRGNESRNNSNNSGNELSNSGWFRIAPRKTSKVRNENRRRIGRSDQELRFGRHPRKREVLKRRRESKEFSRQWKWITQLGLVPDCPLKDLQSQKLKSALFWPESGIERCHRGIDSATIMSTERSMERVKTDYQDWVGLRLVIGDSYKHP